MPPTPQSPKKEPAGPMIGIIIIVILAIFGALYFWGALINSRNAPPQQLPLITGGDTAPAAKSTE